MIITLTNLYAQNVAILTKGDLKVYCKRKLQHLVFESEKNIHQIAKDIGISHTTLSRIVNGNQTDMKLSTAFKLADALGVDINEFRKE